MDLLTAGMEATRPIAQLSVPPLSTPVTVASASRWTTSATATVTATMDRTSRLAVIHPAWHTSASARMAAACQVPSGATALTHVATAATRPIVGAPHHLEIAAL